MLVGCPGGRSQGTLAVARRFADSSGAAHTVTRVGRGGGAVGITVDVTHSPVGVTCEPVEAEAFHQPSPYSEQTEPASQFPAENMSVTLVMAAVLAQSPPPVW